MDGLALLQAADAAGLTVNVDGDRLVIRGPPTVDELVVGIIENCIKAGEPVTTS